MVRRTVVVAMGLALTACARTAAPSGPGDPAAPSGPVILELRSSDDEPLGFLSYGDAEQAGKLGTRCWATQCVDFIGPPTPDRFTDVPGDAVIELRGNGEAESISVGHPPQEEFGQPVAERPVAVEDGRARIELEPGRYMLIVFARWADQGDAVLTFGLDVAS